MKAVPSSEHRRNERKSEYEALVGENHWYFVGNTEKTAIERAAETADALGVERVRLYHTYPSPGPTRRYMGQVADGTFHDARYART